MGELEPRWQLLRCPFEKVPETNEDGLLDHA